MYKVLPVTFLLPLMACSGVAVSPGVDPGEGASGLFHVERETGAVALLSTDAFVVMGTNVVQSAISTALGTEGAMGALEFGGTDQELTFRVQVLSNLEELVLATAGTGGSPVALTLIPDEETAAIHEGEGELLVTMPAQGWYTLQVSTDGSLGGLGILALDGDFLDWAAGTADPFQALPTNGLTPVSLASHHQSLVFTWLMEDGFPCGIVTKVLSDAFAYSCPMLPFDLEPDVCYTQLSMGCEAGANDYDGDGYDDTVDCNDADDSIHPGARERWYDGVDQDCDGWNDYDADRDTYLSDAYGGLDCDDHDDSTHPGAMDIADGVDNDCDGTIDEDAVAWFEPALITFSFYFGYAFGELIDVDGAPPLAVFTLAEEEYLDTYDDAYSCDIYFTLEATAGTTFEPEAWTDLSLSLTPYESGCTDLDPAEWDDEYAGFGDYSWEISVGALTDATIISYLEDWGMYDAETTFAGMISMDGSTMSGVSTDEVLVGWAYEVGPDLSIVDPDNASAIDPVVISGSPAYYQMFAMYIWYL